MSDRSFLTFCKFCLDPPTHPLASQGCRLEFEFVAKGFLFRKGRMKVTLSKIFKVGQGPSQPDQIEPITGSHLVELR